VVTLAISVYMLRFEDRDNKDLLDVIGPDEKLKKRKFLNNSIQTDITKNSEDSKEFKNSLL